MDVNHSRPDIAVTQQFLNRADIISVLQEVRCEAVPQRVLMGPGSSSFRLLSSCLLPEMILI